MVEAKDRREAEGKEERKARVRLEGNEMRLKGAREGNQGKGEVGI